MASQTTDISIYLAIYLVTRKWSWYPRNCTVSTIYILTDVFLTYQGMIMSKKHEVKNKPNVINEVCQTVALYRCLLLFGITLN